MNNRSLNLRHVDYTVNARNSDAYGRSGKKGIQFIKGKWSVSLHISDRNIYLGRYSDIDKAIEVRRLAEEELWGNK